MNPFEHPTTQHVVTAAHAGDPGKVAEILETLTPEETLTVVLLLAQALSFDNPITPYAPNGVRRRTVAQIAAIVGQTAAIHGINPADVYSSNRTRRVREARMIAATVAYWMGNTMTDIGLSLNRDHSTISSAVSRVCGDADLMERARGTMLRCSTLKGTGL